MSTLSKTEAKLLGALAPHLDNLQIFLDIHIRGSNAMTAAAIADAFIKEYKCDLDSDTFIKAFRLAVHENKIKGIAGAKRRGYYRVGEFVAAKVPEEKKEEPPDVLAPYIEGVQKFIDDNIQGTVKMTAAVIYNGFKAAKGCELSEDDFVKSFRAAVHDNKIVGLEGARRFGYGRAGTVSEESEPAIESERVSAFSCEIVIDDHRKIVALDRTNWGYMTRRSGSWLVEAYFANTTEMVRSIARKVIDGELKGMGNFNFAELEHKFQESEHRVAKLLSRAISGKDSSAQEFCIGSAEKEKCHEATD